MKALIIGLELEEGEKKQFGSPRASRTLPRLKLGRRRLGSLGLRAANQFSGWASLTRPRFPRTLVNELVAS